jgi:hypothetical protein
MYHFYSQQGEDIYVFYNYINNQFYILIFICQKNKQNNQQTA